MRHLGTPALLIVVLALTMAGPAQASPDAVVRDCAEDGSVDGDHSDRDKREALKRIPADLDEYSDCRSQIEAGLGGPRAGASSIGPGFGDDALGGGGWSGAGPGGGPISEEARAEAAARERKRALARRETESLLGDRAVDPRTGGVFERADTANGLPLPVLLALIALTTLLAAGAIAAVRRRRPEFLAGALSRVPFPRGRAHLPLRRGR